MIVVWVFGCPILAFIALYRNRHKLNDTAFQRYFIVLYQGLKDDKFYWEIINTSRKVLIVSINVFMSQYPLFYKGALAIIIIIAFIRLQLRLKPFKMEGNNECELLSFTASAVTLFGGLLYVSNQEKVGFIDFITFLVIVLVNINFILFWTYLMSYNLHRFSYARKLTSLLQILLRRQHDINNKDFYLPSSMTSFHLKKLKKERMLKKKKEQKRRSRKKKHRTFKKRFNDHQNDEEEMQKTPKRFKVKKGALAMAKVEEKKQEKFQIEESKGLDG